MQDLINCKQVERDISRYPLNYIHLIYNVNFLEKKKDEGSGRNILRHIFYVSLSEVIIHFRVAQRDFW